MKNYLELILMAERLYRVFLEVLKTEMQKAGILDLTTTQALILYNIGNESLTISDITGRRYYFGSNVSYNLRKMIDYGYLVQQRSDFDKRAIYVALTDRGRETLKKLNEILSRHASYLGQEDIDEQKIAHLEMGMRQLDRSLSHMPL